VSESYDQAKRLARELYDAPAVDEGMPARLLGLIGELDEAEAAYVLAYMESREAGNSHNLAEMFVTGQGPALLTDAVFLEGHCNGNQFTGQERAADKLRAVAEGHGQSVTGKVYVGGLARFPGDPEAWVSGRSDVERVLRQRGWGSEGAVNVSARGLPPKRELALPKVKPFKQRLAEKLGGLGGA
jgi:hypothetical protein